MRGYEGLEKWVWLLIMSTGHDVMMRLWNVHGAVVATEVIGNNTAQCDVYDDNYFVVSVPIRMYNYNYEEGKFPHH